MLVTLFFVSPSNHHDGSWSLTLASAYTGVILVLNSLPQSKLRHSLVIDIQRSTLAGNVVFDSEGLRTCDYYESARPQRQAIR